MSDMYVYMYVCMYVCMHVCTKSFLKPQQIPCVFAHTWRIKLILILILKTGLACCHLSWVLCVLQGL